MGVTEIYLLSYLTNRTSDMTRKKFKNMKFLFLNFHYKIQSSTTTYCTVNVKNPMAGGGMVGSHIISGEKCIHPLSLLTCF